MMREEPVGEPKSNGKPFAISKRLVWEAWRRVRANDGAEGVDEESIQAFEANLRGNLFKVWNRMSSGSYMPPPVRAVEIPKKSGGSRMLGVPTVTSYREVVQRVFGFVGGHASVSSAQR
jgi:retron-type reverse transcriptase